MANTPAGRSLQILYVPPQYKARMHPAFTLFTDATLILTMTVACTGHGSSLFTLPVLSRLLLTQQPWRLECKQVMSLTVFNLVNGIYTIKIIKYMNRSHQTKKNPSYYLPCPQI